MITGRERLYLDTFFGLAAYDRSAITTADFDDYVRCYSAPGALRAAFPYYRALPQDAQDNADLPNLSLPVLALGGEFAQANQVIESARAVADNVIGGIIPNCGHWIPGEQPEALLDHLHTLFATRGGRAPRGDREA